MHRIRNGGRFTATNASVLLLLGVMAAVPVLGSVPSLNPTEWVPATAQIGEASHRDSAPADKTQASSQADLSFAIFPASILPRESEATTVELWWLVTGECRPGFRERIDRPPRREA